MIYLKDKTEFQAEVLDVKGKPVLVDFFAEWCQPCKMMEPVLEKLSTENKDLKIVKVNVDEAQDLAMEYNVMSIPTLYVFKDGQVTKQLVGFQSEGSLLAAIK